MSSNKIELSKSDIEYAIREGKTMGGAAKVLKIDWRTFKSIAESYNLYDPKTNGGYNQYGKKYLLEDILTGKHPQYPTSKLSKRLISEGYKEYKCEHCGITEWNSKAITLELNHIDGNNSNHSLDNLEMLCPNCHSQTPTYRSKKLKYNKDKK